MPARPYLPGCRWRALASRLKDTPHIAGKRRHGRSSARALTLSHRANKLARPVVAALDRLEQLYDAASATLVAALERHLTAGERPSKETLAAACYPLLRVVYHDSARPTPTHRRAFGRLQRIGVYETTVTHPREFR